MQGWYDALIANIKAGDVRTFNDHYWQPASWPSHMNGVGLLEAPRGGLSHWIVVDDGKISNYQAVVPSTWNVGPRDALGQPGPYEATLQHNHQLIDTKQPFEILRTVHSFDPCIACAIHVTDLARRGAGSGQSQLVLTGVVLLENRGGLDLLQPPVTLGCDSK